MEDKATRDNMRIKRYRDAFPEHSNRHDSDILEEINDIKFQRKFINKHLEADIKRRMGKG